MRIYSLLDRKAREFGAPMWAKNDDVMKRLLKDTLPHETIAFEHPGDFDLFFLGSMSEDTGVIAAGAPQLVVTLQEVLYGSGQASDGRPLAADDAASSGYPSERVVD